MISTAFSVLGIPAATQKSSMGNPSFLISYHNGSWKDNCCGLMYSEIRVIMMPGGIFNDLFAQSSSIIVVVTGELDVEAS
jgi:hypothetical protein